MLCDIHAASEVVAIDARPWLGIGVEPFEFTMRRAFVNDFPTLGFRQFSVSDGLVATPVVCQFSGHQWYWAVDTIGGTIFQAQMSNANRVTLSSQDRLISSHDVYTKLGGRVRRKVGSLPENPSTFSAVRRRYDTRRAAVLFQVTCCPLRVFNLVLTRLFRQPIYGVRFPLKRTARTTTLAGRFCHFFCLFRSGVSWVAWSVGLE
jgi:hypothetical protein